MNPPIIPAYPAREAEYRDDGSWILWLEREPHTAQATVTKHVERAGCVLIRYGFYSAKGFFLIVRPDGTEGG
jgi:hypothetical protein